MTAADELRAAAASIRAGDMPADPDKFLAAVADWLVNFAGHTEDGDYGPDETDCAEAVARAWNAELP